MSPLNFAKFYDRTQVSRNSFIKIMKNYQKCGPLRLQFPLLRLELFLRFPVTLFEVGLRVGQLVLLLPDLALEHLLHLLLHLGHLGLVLASLLFNGGERVLEGQNYFENLSWHDWLNCCF